MRIFWCLIIVALLVIFLCTVVLLDTVDDVPVFEEDTYHPVSSWDYEVSPQGHIYIYEYSNH